MYLLVPAHPGCPGQGPESCKMAVCVPSKQLVITDHDDVHVDSVHLEPFHLIEVVPLGLGRCLPTANKHTVAEAHIITLTLVGET